MTFMYQHLLNGIHNSGNLPGVSRTASASSTEGLRTWATQWIKGPIFQFFHLSHLTQL